MGSELQARGQRVTCTAISLSRYLYRDVINDKSILSSQQGAVTFSYISSETGKKETRTLPGEDCLWLVLKHVFPRGFRRSRDYGFLHSNAKKKLSLVQLILNVMVSAVKPVIRPTFKCRHCGEAMKHTAFSFLNQPETPVQQQTPPFTNKEKQ